MWNLVSIFKDSLEVYYKSIYGTLFQFFSLEGELHLESKFIKKGLTMEKSVQIIQQGALVERPYQDRNGQQQVFASMGWTLTDGIDTFYAEMQGDLARSYRDVHPDPSLLHRVQTQMSIREFKDKDGNSRFSNEIRIIKLV